MANYQELLSKAVGALPENNGVSRRDVYEKARKALVAQLRAINPPLPAREITQHRLELEDCIREVEHSATEALLGGLKETSEETIPVVEPEAPTEAEPVQNSVAEADAAPAPESEKEAVVAEKPTREEKSEPEKTPDVTPKAPAPKEAASESNGEQATAPKESAAQTSEPKSSEAAPASDTEKQSETLDEIIAQAEESKAKPGGNDKPVTEEVKISSTPETLEPVASNTRESDKGIGAAMSRVREVDNDTSSSAVKGPVITQAAPRSSPPADVVHKENVGAEVSHQGSPLESADAVNLNEVKPASEPVLSDAELLAQKLTGVRAGPPSASVDRNEGETDAQSVVDRAIQTLDREARGEGAVEENGEEIRSAKINPGDDLSVGEAAFGSVGDEEKSSGGLTVFLVLVILLLGAVGGGGYWAWKEGFVDLDSVFASSGESQEQVQTPPEPVQTQTGTPIRQVGATSSDEPSGPGNTATDVETTNANDPNVALEDPNKDDDRLVATQEGSDAQGDVNVAQSNGADDKVEDRLGANNGATDPSLTQQGDPASIGANTGAQSLLLEASNDGTSGAVPFSGTVEWSRGVDELGEPTLIGQANIPARNMKVKVLIRRNGDASLPASHLMEIDFDVSETFVGGAVAGLPGILLKNEELVQGVALVGASARVVGNSFLFALSAADQDLRTNLDLLENRKWMDLALIYASGNRAIITLEKDDAAQALFRDVMASWQSASGAGAAPDTSSVVLDSVDGAGATDLIQDSAAPVSN